MILTKQQLKTVQYNPEEQAKLFTQSYDWFESFKLLAQSPMEKREFAQLFSQHLPVEQWLDIDLVKNHILTLAYNNGYVSDLAQISWYIENNKIRQIFTAEEKGCLLKVGLQHRLHEIAFCSSIDKDWQYDFSSNPKLLHEEALRVYNVFQMSPVTESYVTWMTQTIFPHFPLYYQAEVLVYLLAATYKGLIHSTIQNVEVGCGLDKERILNIEKQNLFQEKMTTLIHLTCYQEWNPLVQKQFLSQVKEHAYPHQTQDFFDQLCKDLEILFLHHKLNENLIINSSTSKFKL